MHVFWPTWCRATFYRLMDTVIKLHGSYCAAYLYDVIVFSSARKCHILHYENIISAIATAGLTINPAKCKIVQKETSFFRNIIEGREVKQGLSISSKKINILL